MTQFLPPNLLALFAPREPIPFLPPPDKLPHEKKNVHNYSGVAAFIANNFEDPSETPAPTKVEMRSERMERKRREKEEQVAYKLEQEIAMWDPTSNENGTTDPFKTLFVSRVNYYTSESKLRREFEAFGPIKKIVVVNDSISEKPRGYCFIEYEHERDMHSAYKKADGMKIDGRRVLVDVERSRTVKGWLPRRLGGGLGGTRRGGVDVNTRHSGREDGPGRRSRSRSAEARRRSRSPRDRGDRGDRDRDRDRDRRRRRSRSGERKRSKRSRSRSGERDRKRKRSRSRERSKRDRSRDRSSRKERRRDRDGGLGGQDDAWPGGVAVKEEPNDDYDGYGYDNVQVKQEA